MPRKGSPIVVVDRYTMAVIATYPSVKEASRDLGIPQSTIYQCLCFRVPSYESYFIYKEELRRWKPANRIYMRVRGLKVSQRLEELRKKNQGGLTVKGGKD